MHSFLYLVRWQTHHCDIWRSDVIKFSCHKKTNIFPQKKNIVLLKHRTVVPNFSDFLFECFGFGYLLLDFCVTVFMNFRKGVQKQKEQTMFYSYSDKFIEVTFFHVDLRLLSNTPFSCSANIFFIFSMELWTVNVIVTGRYFTNYCLEFFFIFNSLTACGNWGQWGYVGLGRVNGTSWHACYCNMFSIAQCTRGYLTTNIFYSFHFVHTSYITVDCKLSLISSEWKCKLMIRFWLTFSHLIWNIHHPMFDCKYCNFF